LEHQTLAGHSNLYRSLNHLRAHDVVEFIAKRQQCLAEISVLALRASIERASERCPELIHWCTQGLSERDNVLIAVNLSTRQGSE
jgi:hypothetical protein